MTGLCKDCKHWGDPEERFDGTAWDGLRKCMAVPESWDDNYDSREDDKRFRAFVEDGSMFRARLLTRPDFGCVLFEPRP